MKFIRRTASGHDGGLSLLNNVTASEPSVARPSNRVTGERYRALRQEP